MTEKENERFDRLLKAMVQGEPPKQKRKDQPADPKRDHTREAE